MAIGIRSNGQISYPFLSAGAFTPALAVREAGPVGAPKPRLLDRVPEAIAARHYGIAARRRTSTGSRMTMLPAAVKEALIAHLERAREQFQADLRHGPGGVELPNALTRRYPNAGRDWGGSGCSSPASVAGTTSMNPFFNAR